MKKMLIYLLLSLVFTEKASAVNNLELIKDGYKYDIAVSAPSGNNVISIANDLKSDAMLEIASEGYVFYKDYASKETLNIPQSREILLISPRIDLLEKHLDNLAKYTGDLLVFLLENDKLEGLFGDRSYNTYVSKGLNEKLPRNVKVFKLNSKRKNFEIVDLAKLDTDIEKEIIEIHDLNSQFKLKK